MASALLRWILAAAIVALGLTPAAAMEMRAGPAGRLGPGETIDDDLYLAAGLVSVDGRVRGDLVASGGTLNFRGQVDGGVLAAAGTLDLSGTIGTTARIVGGTVSLRGTVGADAVAAGGTVLVEGPAQVRRDLAAAGGTVIVAGTVGRHARLAGGRVEIGGTVNGNLLVRGGEIVILPSAVVRGNLTYSSEQPIRIAQGSRIHGTVTQEQYPVRPVPSRAARRGFRVAFGVVDFFWMLMIALALIAVAPRGVQATADTLRARPWASLGWGALLLFSVPMLVIALMVMIIGIPVGVILLVVHVLALFTSHAAAGLALGQRITPGVASRYASIAVGVAVIAIATHIPYAGWLLRLASVAIGLGAIALTLWERRNPPAGAPSNVSPPEWPAVA
jgi:cytoskeletal protein CcmA (bactofilin family)